MERETTENDNWRFSFFGGSSSSEAVTPAQIAPTLARVEVGKKVRLTGFQGREGTNRLLGMGLSPGVKVQVISSQPSGSVVIALDNNRIGIGAEVAENILVQEEESEPEIRTYLKEMPNGTVGRIVGYEQVMRGYKGKLLSMGLTPGTEFTVVRVAPLGDPIEICVRGFNLSLRKQEADALVVEEVDL